MAQGYRDRIFMRKDVILKLAEYGRLNQTRLFNYCGLNSSKHRDILDGLEEKGFISKTVSARPARARPYIRSRPRAWSSAPGC